MGSRILAGRYELIEKIGEGGMAVVFKSRDRLLNRYVAIKILRPEYTKDESFIDSFRRESQIAANLVHPNIVNVYDVGKEGNIYYIVMELIDGKPLSEVIKEEAPLEPRRAATIAKQIASALSMAHKNQLIHRDVKPHNVLMTSDGVAKISDFGIAQAVTSDTFVGDGTKQAVMGSVHYFSPEQARGAYVDEKSDIYSLGIVLYEMLTGRVPFDGDTAVAVAVKHMNEPMIPPTKFNAEIPSDLEEIVLKATNKLQMNRFRTADELITALNFVKFSRYSDPAAAAAAAKANGHSKDTLTELSDENYARELEQAAAEGGNLNTEEAMARRREKREEKKNSKKGKRPPFSEDDPEDEYNVLRSAAPVTGDGESTYSASVRRHDDDDDDEYAEREPYVFHPGRLIVVMAVILILMGIANFAIGLFQGVKNEFNVAEHEAPKLLGMHYEEARKELEKIGVTLVIETTLPDDDRPAGEITSQAPSEGAVIKEGQSIRVTISGGGKPADTVPDVLGMQLTRAATRISDKGYELGEVTEDYSEEYGIGLVISQDPAEGTEMPAGSHINLVVSLGSENGVNIVGMSLEEAQIYLEEQGIEIGSLTNTVNTSVERGVIISTNPGPGEELKDGQAIDIVVSKGSDRTMPDVTLKNDNDSSVNIVGMTLDEALSYLEGRGIKVGSLNNAVSPSVPRGVIINTNPGPGQELAEGQAVDILVSMGKDNSQGVFTLPGDEEPPVEDPADDPNEGQQTEDPGENQQTDDPGKEQTDDPGESSDIPAPANEIKSVGIYLNFSSLSAETFNLIVVVEDGINARSTTDLGSRNKSDGGETIIVSGSGSNGKVSVTMGTELYRFDVDFTAGTATQTSPVNW